MKSQLSVVNPTHIFQSFLWNTGDHARRVRYLFRNKGKHIQPFEINNVQTCFKNNSFIFVLAPVIMSSPENSYGPLGANLTLDCEARGYPAPTITWQFVSTEGKTISLPSRLILWSTSHDLILTQDVIFISTFFFFEGDDQHVAIQMRGGPEPLMVTGWMQIMSLDPSYIGTYHCIATNALGQVYSMATVGVYKNEELWSKFTNLILSISYNTKQIFFHIVI